MYMSGLCSDWLPGNEVVEGKSEDGEEEQHRDDPSIPRCIHINLERARERERERERERDSDQERERDTDQEGERERERDRDRERETQTSTILYYTTTIYMSIVLQNISILSTMKAMPEVYTLNQLLYIYIYIYILQYISIVLQYYTLVL